MTPDGPTARDTAMIRKESQITNKCRVMKSGRIRPDGDMDVTAWRTTNYLNHRKRLRYKFVVLWKGGYVIRP